MDIKPELLCFDQLHVDVARNATDDFNPFHDPYRWHHIRGNPYGGPLVLGFQLAALADHRVELQRAREVESGPPAANARYRNYQLHFAGALQPGETFSIAIRRTLYERGGAGTALNRFVLRKQSGQPLLVGTRADGPAPLLSMATPDTAHLQDAADRALLPGTSLFLKRKYLTTSNGKNFLLGSLIDQRFYFDELAEQVRFPPAFTASLISCALLERARAEGYDFERTPLVYVSQQIAVDMSIQRGLRSNDRLDVLVGPASTGHRGKGLAQASVEQQSHRCFGLIAGRGVLFQAEVQTAALDAIVAGVGRSVVSTRGAGAFFECDRASKTGLAP
jgi:hypothetical protein